MAGDLSGRVALIAGGGGEIGGAIARRFAEAGAAIAIADIRREAAEIVAGEITAAGGQAVAVRTNVAVEEDAERAVRHAVEAFGKLTTLVNVAATVTPDGTVETLTLDDWNDALAVNLTGAFLMCKYAVPEIRKAGGGTIVNIASQLGQIGVGGRAPYTTSKAGLIQFTRMPRDRSRRRRHPRQFAVAGRRRHRAHPAPLQGPRGSEPRPRPGLPARPSRPGRGNRGRRAVPRVRGVLVHDRGRPFARRRLSCVQGLPAREGQLERTHMPTRWIAALAALCLAADAGIRAVRRRLLPRQDRHHRGEHRDRRRL